MARLLWIAWLAAGAVYLAMLAWSLPHLTALAGGLPMFDMRPGGYSGDEARALLAALGDDGRAFYLNVQHRLDAVFPALEALALSLSFPRLFPRLVSRVLIAVSLAAAAFDWLENVAVADLLRADPLAVTAPMIAVASRWSVLKSGCVSVAMTALLVGLGLALWRRVRVGRG